MKTIQKIKQLYLNLLRAECRRHSKKAAKLESKIMMLEFKLRGM